MQLNKLSPAAGSKRSARASVEVSAAVSGKTVVVVTKANNHVPAVSTRVGFLKAARCRCSAVCPRYGFRSSLARVPQKCARAIGRKRRGRPSRPSRCRAPGGADDQTRARRSSCPVTIDSAVTVRRRHPRHQGCPCGHRSRRRQSRGIRSGKATHSRWR